ETPIETYNRSGVPPDPLHIDQLSPAQRARVKDLHFPDLSFAEATNVQPLERYECASWSEDSLAYVCSDGKTVRPMRGREAEFSQFCEAFRAAHPEEARKYRFEMPPDGK